MPDVSVIPTGGRAAPLELVPRDHPANIDLCVTEPLDLSELIRTMGERSRPDQNDL
ncbi:hypothetical protein [Subtercola boreus]|uniref:hypothetical protein n=1 Tax=Subtercola boreus TaxID=120213 RepID=UPI001558C50C|nr:hypothetical protein [Subtercola boreus]